MSGVGFGGCNINIVKADKVEAFNDKVESEYEKRIGYKPSFYLSKAGDGGREIEN